MTLGRSRDEEYLEGELEGVDIGKKSQGWTQVSGLGN